jgi:hypothetical protein
MYLSKCKMLMLVLPILQRESFMIIMVLLVIYALIVKLFLLGIRVYEMFKDEFRDISDELSDRDLDESKRKELKNV